MKKEILIPNCNSCPNSNSAICKLKTDEKEKIEQIKKGQFYKKGQQIFELGTNANFVFCVYNGKIKLTKLGKEGKEQIFRFSKKGDLLGYRSVLSNEPYNASAVVMEDSIICQIPRDAFFNVIESNYSLSLDLIQLLTKDLKGAEQHLIDVAQKTVRERIAEALITLINTFGFKPDNKTLNIKITRSEIAEIASTTTESAIRTLSNFNNEGLIHLDGKRIIINDLIQLQQNTNLL